jgi:type I restriction enzyme S subunit
MVDIPWLSKIPSHWDTRKAKWLFTKMDRPVNEEDDVVTCFRDGTVTLRKNRRLRGFTESLKEIGYQGIRKGDLVIHAMDAFAGAVGVSDSDGKGTPVYSVCKPAVNVNPYYYAYVVREMARNQWILALSKGIRERSTDFRFEEFANQVLPLPLLEEQEAIVRYLDHVDRLIKHYIHAKKKQIKLLNEQKQAIIRHAVICGLDSKINLKPSGVDWLGDVPKHWKLRRLKFLATIKTGGRDTVDRKDDGQFPFFVRSQIVERIDTFSFDGEAVLTAGDGAGVAKVFHYINGKFDYHQRVYRFSNFQQILGKFFFYYFSNSLKFEAFRETAKSTVDSLRLPMLQNFPMVLPPIDEQIKIIEFINYKTEYIEQSLKVVKKEITLIQDFHTRLISNVVTGKLDVRTAAILLPEELAEIEPLEEEIDEIENFKESDEEVTEGDE